MKQLSRLAAAAALAVGSMVSTGAIAGPTCGLTCTFQGSNTYVGSVDPGSFGVDNFTMTRSILPPPGGSVPVGTALSDFWIFDIFPEGNFRVNFNYQGAPGGLLGARIQLWSAIPEGVGSSCGPLSGLGLFFGQQCSYTSDPRSSFVALGDSNNYTPGLDGSVFIPNMGLAAGRYAISISGTTTSEASSYSGQVFVARVPEPASLALVGIALLGAAAGLRRSRKA